MTHRNRYFRSDAKIKFFLTVVFLVCCGGCQYLDFWSKEEQEAPIPPPERPRNLPAPSGGMVLSVGDDTITASEIVQPLMDKIGPAARATDFENFKKQLRPELERIVINEVSDRILQQKAMKKVGESAEELLNESVETEIRKFISSYAGDYAKAEDQLKQMGKDWQSYRKYLKKRILTQSFISSKMPEEEPITYQDLIEVYNLRKEEHFSTPPKIQFQLINIQPAKLDISDPNLDRRKKAVSICYEILSQLRVGNDFGELAKEYSHGYRARYGGVWESVNPNSLAEPYDVLGEKAMDMKPGQISGLIHTPKNIFVMKLLDKQEEKTIPFEEVQKEIEQQIRIQRRMEMINEISSKIAQQAELKNKEEFIEFCLRRLYEGR